MLWKGLNSNLPCYRNTTRMLEYDDKNLIFAKSLLDLGATQFHLYLGKPKTIMMKHISELLKLYRRYLNI